MTPAGRYHGIPTRRCVDCGGTFYPKVGYARRCYPCWVDAKESQDADTRADTERRLTAATAEIARLMDENRVLKLQNQSLTDAADRPPIPPDMHRRLIYLCHPDKHANSPAATIATAWLLETRR